MSLLKKILAFEDHTFMVGPNSDGGFAREEQAADVALPHQPFEIREALPVEPYYLGNEKKFYEQCKPEAPAPVEVDEAQYPMLVKALKTEF